MLNLMELQTFSNEAVRVMPWLQGIQSDEQYDELVELMDTLVEDYDANQVLIDVLFPIIERYEEEAGRFKAFNERIEGIDQGVAMLRVIMDQHGLKTSDFPNEIGNKSNVSQVLNGKRSLTLGHIKALSQRFGIPASMFV
jgi:HTH-type transcriptional regulator/antitoxin HigA